MNEAPTFRSGYVAVVGRPNVGKSTLINVLVGAKAAIVSNKPQTTRNSIRAVLNDPRGQMVFIDTPGLHRPLHDLGRFMERQAAISLEMADVVCFLVEAGTEDRKGNEINLTSSRAYRSVVLVVNKIDEPGPPACLIDVTVSRRKKFVHTVLVTPLEGRNLDLLLDTLFSIMPPDSNSRTTGRWVLHRTIPRCRGHQEQGSGRPSRVPHSVAVLVEVFKSPESTLKRNLLVPQIFCGESCQKAILIEKGGARLKSIVKSPEGA
jgi:GTP-binding protein Era